MDFSQPFAKEGTVRTATASDLLDSTVIVRLRQSGPLQIHGSHAAILSEARICNAKPARVRDAEYDTLTAPNWMVKRLLKSNWPQR